MQPRTVGLSFRLRQITPLPLESRGYQRGIRELETRDTPSGEGADLILTPEVRVPNVLNRPYADAVAELS
jgi:hypothetical protein